MAKVSGQRPIARMIILARQLNTPVAIARMIILARQLNTPVAEEKIAQFVSEIGMG